MEVIKFVHASDFHLDQPMSGLVELPNHLKSTLANAPYAAAENVFDLAITERVDFVLLAGDLFDMETAGPRATAFLLNQFRRLAEHQIKVYWCAGETDQPDRWPTAIELPENVVTFSGSSVESVVHYRDSVDGRVAVATILGTGNVSQCKNEDFRCPSNAAYPLALCYGEPSSSVYLAESIRYWALGGKHKTRQRDYNGAVACYPGTTQSRNRKEIGPRGCKLCRVDNAGKIRIQDVETDVVRWLPQKVSIHEHVNLTELKDELGERAMKIAADTDITILINWYLATTGEFNPQIRRSEWRADLLEWLRDEFGRSDRGIWSVQVKIEPPSSLPTDWYEEDTILGEFLRAVGRFQSDDSIKIALHDYLPNSVESEMMADISHVAGERRDEVLRRTALNGIEYLAADRETAVETV